MNFDVKHDIPSPKKPVGLRPNSAITFTVTQGSELLIPGAQIVLSKAPKGPDQTYSIIKESGKNGSVLFGGLTAGTYFYRVTSGLKSDGIRFGKVQLAEFSEQTVHVSF